MNLNQVFIRRLKIDDLEHIQKFCFEQVSHNNDPLTQLRISERQYAWEMKRLRQEWLVQQRYIAYVAVEKKMDHETILGYGAALITHQPHFFSIETIATLGELWVAPEYRGHGIGKNIVNAIVDTLKECGITWFSLHLAGKEREAEAFFLKLGFSNEAMELRKCLTDDIT